MTAAARSQRWMRRAWTVGVVTPLLMLATASAARAGDDVTAPPAALSWMEMQDSRGISVWHYDLSMDRGGPTSPIKAMWGFLTDLGWQVYRSAVGFVLWLVDWTLSFSWLEPLSQPVATVSSSVSDVISRFGLVPVMLTLAGFVAICYLVRGSFATGLYEIVMSAAVAALAIGVFANPLGMVTGNDGWLLQARNLGLEIGAATRADTAGSSDPDEVRAQISEDMADIFIRTPHQLINFNQLVDGTKCEDTYDKALGWHLESSGGGLGGDQPVLVDGNGDPFDRTGTGVLARQAPPNSYLRDEMGDCDPALKEAADNPSWSTFINMAVLGLGGICLVVLTLVLCASVLVSSLYAMFLAVKMLWNLLIGILPGGQRVALARTASELVMALVLVVFAMVFLIAYLQVVLAVFGAAEPPQDGPFGVEFQPAGNTIKKFVFLDVLLAAGVVIYWRTRKAMKSGAGPLAQALAKRPGPAPRPLPAASGMGVTAGRARAHARTAHRITANTTSAGIGAGKRAGHLARSGTHGAVMGTVAGGYLIGKVAATGARKVTGGAVRGSGDSGPLSASVPGASRPRATAPTPGLETGTGTHTGQLHSSSNMRSHRRTRLAAGATGTKPSLAAREPQPALGMGKPQAPPPAAATPGVGKAPPTRGKEAGRQQPGAVSSTNNKTTSTPVTTTRARSIPHRREAAPPPGSDGAGRSYDRVVRGGQILLIPRDQH